MLNKNHFAATAGAFVLAVAGMASAGEASAPMEIAVGLESECVIDAQDVHASITGATTNQSIGMSVSVQCNAGTPYTVGIDRGLNDGFNPEAPDQRALVAIDESGSSIPYEVFQDESETRLWGDLDSGDAYSAVADGEWQQVPARIRFDRINFATSGAYSDQVNSTVRF
jgi:spore coat protein U-like protein